VSDALAPRLITLRTKQDQTERMLQWARRRVRELEKEDLCGFIFKGKSPSCGRERVKVYNARGVSAPKGVGIFAQVFMDHFSLLPVEDDGRLHDPVLCANFIERCFVMKEWRDCLRQQRRSRGELVGFHSAHELLILSHSPRHQRIMGKLVAQARIMPIGALYDEYQRLLVESLRLMATPAKHGNVLHRITGYFKKQLARDEREELQEVIDCYRQGRVPLSVPINRINHYARLYDLAYLRRQRYLHTHPLEVKLRDLL
jgi:uncharacterized protein YbgA (DUF1722 family)